MTIRVVGVQFQHELQPGMGYRDCRSKVYNYLTDISDIKVGDIVVVDSPTTAYTCVTVVEVREPGEPNRGLPAYKWVVSRVDDSHHLERQIRLQRMAEVERQLKEEVRIIREQIDYEEIVRRSPKAASLLTELNYLKTR